MMRTDDYPIVDEWVNNVWPEEAKQAIQKFIPDYTKSVVMRTATTQLTIASPLKEQARLVINYDSSKKCFIIWNAAIQKVIHPRKKIHISYGAELEKNLCNSDYSNALIPVFREIGSGGSGKVELILIVGEEAFPDFCKEYKEKIKPDKNLIPKGKECLYAEAGGKIQYIKREDS